MGTDFNNTTSLAHKLTSHGILRDQPAHPPPSRQRLPQGRLHYSWTRQGLQNRPVCSSSSRLVLCSARLPEGGGRSDERHQVCPRDDAKGHETWQADGALPGRRQGHDSCRPYPPSPCHLPTAWLRLLPHQRCPRLGPLREDQGVRQGPLRTDQRQCLALSRCARRGSRRPGPSRLRRRRQTERSRSRRSERNTTPLATSSSRISATLPSP